MLIIRFSLAVLNMDNISTWIALSISITIGLVVAAIVQILVVPWHRHKVLECVNANEPVQFSIDDSDEASPSGSPSHTKPLSSIGDQANGTPAISEQTELASFNNLSSVNPKLLNNQKTGTDSDLKHFSKYIGNNNANYKIDPKIVAKAENLLGNKNSLDNTDLTATSLKYIDDQQQTKQNGYLTRPMNGGKGLETFFDRSHNSPTANKG